MMTSSWVNDADVIKVEKFKVEKATDMMETEGIWVLQTRCKQKNGGRQT